jgi:hypothetical protein
MTRSAVPSPRILVLLSIGHGAVGLGTAAAVLLLGDHYLDTPPTKGPGLLEWLLLAGLVLLAALQAVAVRTLIAHRGALVSGDLDAARTCAAVRTIARTALLALVPLALGVNSLVHLPLPVPLLTLLGSLVVASLLLDHAHAAWTYRHLPRWGPAVRALPAGAVPGAQAQQGALLLLFGLLTAVGLVLLGVTTIAIATKPSDAPLPARLLGLLAAAAVVLVPLLLIRTMVVFGRAVGRADGGAAVHLPTLDTTSRMLGRVAQLAAVAAALVVAAALTASGPDAVLAVGLLIPLALALGFAAVQATSNTQIALADPRSFNQPRR